MLDVYIWNKQPYASCYGTYARRRINFGYSGYMSAMERWAS